MWKALAELHKEALVKRDAAAVADVELDHPSLYAIGIELIVPRTIERVGEVHALSVTADLHHLWRTVKFLSWPGRMLASADDTADAHRPGESRLERVRHIVLAQFSRAPTGYI